MTRILKAIADGEHAELTPEEYAQLADMKAGRTCDGCAMCCKLPSIEEPELTKPANAWCKYCDTGRARCKIYDTRPAVCSSFHCGWLLFGNFVPEHWKPSRSRMMIHMPELIPAVKIVVDKPAHGRWRENPWLSDIYNMRENFKTAGVDVYLEEIHRGGMWVFAETEIVFIPQEWSLIKVRDIYCPMPKTVEDYYMSHPAERPTLWAKYCMERTIIKVNRRCNLTIPTNN